MAMVASEAPTRWIIGNLDCESDWANAQAGAPSPFSLPERVLKTISSLATLLRAFAREGDVLWTPRPVRPQRIVEHPEISGPSLRSGELPRVTRALVWGQTARWDGVESSDRTLPDAAELESASGSDILRALPRSPSSKSIVANDRHFCLELGTDLDCRLPAARLIDSPEELVDHLRSDGLAPTGDWVLKAPFSAAGRWRCRGRGIPAEGSPSMGAARNLIERFGRVIFEPWFERTLDFGCCALVHEEGHRLLGIHRQTVDGGGRFTGLAVPLGAPAPSELTAGEVELIEATLRGVADRLHKLGYRGPFSVDGWRYRNHSGREVLHPLGEINARLSFGFVARALAERLAPRAEGGAADEARLRFGKAIPATKDPATSILPLLLPDEEDPTAAWLEFGPAR